MALPSNRIKKVKLNGDTAYEIIPESLQKNGHQASLPNLSADATLATTADLAAKQDALVSGTNIKTINSKSVLGSGNLEIGGHTLTIQVSGTIPSTSGLLVCFADGRNDVLLNAAGEYNNVIGYSISGVDVTNPLGNRVVLDSVVGGLYLNDGQDVEGIGILLGNLTLAIAPKASGE